MRGRPRDDYHGSDECQVVSESYHYKIKKNIVDEVIICVQSSKRFITYHIFYSTQQHIIKGGARRARCNAVPNHSTPKLAIGISTTFATTSGRSRPRCATITKDSRAGGPSTMHRTRMAVSRIIVFPCASYTSNDLSPTPHTSCSHIIPLSWSNGRRGMLLVGPRSHSNVWSMVRFCLVNVCKFLYDYISNTRELIHSIR